MSTILESGTISAISLALNGTTMRHQAIAHNLANVNMPGFKPVAVRFDLQFDELQRVLQQPGGSKALADYQPYFQQVEPDAKSSTVVSIDDQTAQLAQNVLHHQALLKALNKQFSILSIAVAEGKR